MATGDGVRHGMRERSRGLIAEANFEASAEKPCQRSGEAGAQGGIDDQVVVRSPDPEQRSEHRDRMLETTSRQAKHPLDAEESLEDVLCDIAFTDDIDLGALVTFFKLADQRSQEEGVTQPMVGPADQNAVDALPNRHDRCAHDTPLA